MNIRKSELARELGISKARVSQLLRLGMPALSNGRLDRASALEWIARTQSPAGRNGANITAVAERLLNHPAGGNPRSQGYPDDLLMGALAEAVLPPTFVRKIDPGSRAIIDRLVTRSRCLPELLAHIGCRDMIAISSVIDIWQALVCLFLGDYVDVYDWTSEDLPRVDHPNYAALAEQLGEPVNAEVWQRAIDGLIERVFRFGESRFRSEWKAAEKDSGPGGRFGESR